MYELAQKRDMKFLSTEYLGRFVEHEWQCNKCGKIYQLKPNNVQIGTSCRICKLKRRKEQKVIKPVQIELDNGEVVKFNLPI